MHVCACCNIHVYVPDPLTLVNAHDDLAFTQYVYSTVTVQVTVSAFTLVHPML